MQVVVERLHLLPEPRRLPSRSRRAACRNRERHSSPRSSKPSSRAPSFASSTKRWYFGRIGARDRVPAHPRLGELVVVAAVGDDFAELVEVLAAGLLGTSLLLPCGQYLPSPYMASSSVVSVGELRALGGVGGAGALTPSLISCSDARGRRIELVVRRTPSRLRPPCG